MTNKNNKTTTITPSHDRHLLTTKNVFFFFFFFKIQILDLNSDETSTQEMSVTHTSITDDHPKNKQRHSPADTTEAQNPDNQQSSITYIQTTH